MYMQSTNYAIYHAPSCPWGNRLGLCWVYLWALLISQKINISEPIELDSLISTRVGLNIKIPKMKLK